MPSETVIKGNEPATRLKPAPLSICQSQAPGAIRPELTARFQSYGYPAWFQMFIGICEVCGAIGLLVPRLAFFAALGLLLIMLGALWTVWMAGQGVAAPLFVGLALAYVAWARRP